MVLLQQILVLVKQLLLLGPSLDWFPRPYLGFWMTRLHSLFVIPLFEREEGGLIKEQFLPAPGPVYFPLIWRRTFSSVKRGQ